LSFDADDGELVVVLGPSGCGKTTLLSSLAGLLTPTSGSVTFRGDNLIGLTGQTLAHHRRYTVGIVFQAFNLLPSLSAKGNVMAPLRLAKTPRRQAAARADELLELVGLTDRAGHRPGEMSGGQQQRVAIARALVQNPPMVLADEPTAHLDHIQVEGVLRLLRELAAPGRLVIVATHDDRITNIADRVVELVAHFAERDPEDVTLSPGEILFHQGDRGDLVYVIEEGDIEIYRERADGTEEILATVNTGQYFGELGPMLNLPRSATARARARKPTRLTGYTVRTFRQRFPNQNEQTPPTPAHPNTTTSE
jgi:putative ABC transport system ATP-binding protein